MKKRKRKIKYFQVLMKVSALLGEHGGKIGMAKTMRQFQY